MSYMVEVAIMVKNSGFLQKKSSIEAPQSIILRLVMVMFIGIFLINLISAPTWTRSVEYNEEDVREVTFKNWFGLGATQGTMTLTSHELDERGEIKTLKVGLGKQVVMSYDINFNQKFVDVLGDVEFINMKTGQPIERDYKFVYLDTEELERENCIEWGTNETEIGGSKNETGNETQVCLKWETETYEIDIWKDYNLRNIPEGEITIGIEVETKQGDYIDGIWNIGSKRLDRHASWEASLEVGLVAWWEFEDDDYLDSHIFDYHGTAVGTLPIVDGKVGNAINLSGSNTFLNITSSSGVSKLDLTGDTFAWNMWVYPYDVEDGGVLGKETPVSWHGGYRSVFFQQEFNAELAIGGYKPQKSNKIWTTNEWQMSTITYNGTDVCHYRNGTLDKCASQTGNIDSSSTSLLIGALRNPTSNNYNGLLDEFGFWNRSLTQEEITLLWNDGDGLGYQEYTLIEIELLTPANNTITSDTEITFSGNVTDGGSLGIKNVSLLINGEINDTQVSSLEGLYSWNDTTLSEGSYNWSMIVFDDDSTQHNSSVWYFTIDTTDPVIQGKMNVTNTAWGEDVRVDYNITDNVELDECWYEYDGSNTTIICGTEQDFDFTTVTDEYTLTIWANDTAGNIASLTLFINKGHEFTLTSPADNVYLDYDEVDFIGDISEIGTGAGIVGIENVSLVIDGVIEQTNTSGLEGEYTFTITLTDDEYVWKLQSVGGDGITYESATRIATIDTTDPVIASVDLVNLFSLETSVNSSWEINATDTNLRNCWYNTTDHTTSNVTCNTNIQTEWATSGTKSITFCADDLAGNIACDTETIEVRLYTSTATQDKNVVGEGDQVEFKLEVEGLNLNTEFSQTNASFELHGHNYGEGTKAVTTNKITFTQNIIIPSGSGNETGIDLDWEWDFNIQNSTTIILSDTENGDINVINVTISDDCGSKYIFLNWTLYDQGDKTVVNVTAPNTAKVEIDLRISSLYNPTGQYWEYSNTWTDTQTKQLCVPHSLLNETSYKIEWIMGYDSNDRVREFHYLDNGVLDKTGSFNSHTEKDLELFNLKSADSTTFLFKFTNENNQNVPSAIVHVYRKYIGEGIFLEVERGKQDSGGETHIHLVEEDVIYYFMITEEGVILFTSTVYHAKCLAQPCQITLTASKKETDWDVFDNEGGKYTISSVKATRTATVEFDLEGNVSTITASLYKYDGVNPIQITNNSLTASSGSIDLVAPLVYGNDTFFVTVHREESFVKSGWADFTEGGRDYFGTFGAVLGALIVLTLILMAVSEGAGIIIFSILGLIIIRIMQLVDLSWMALISIICAGGIIMWKLVNRRGVKG